MDGALISKKRQADLIGELVMQDFLAALNEPRTLYRISLNIQRRGQTGHQFAGDRVEYEVISTVMEFSAETHGGYHDGDIVMPGVALAQGTVPLVQPRRISQLKAQNAGAAIPKKGSMKLVGRLTNNRMSSAMIFAAADSLKERAADDNTEVRQVIAMSRHPRARRIDPLSKHEMIGLLLDIRHLAAL